MPVPIPNHYELISFYRYRYPSPFGDLFPQTKYRFVIPPNELQKLTDAGLKCLGMN